jgi:hypothetical protein
LSSWLSASFLAGSEWVSTYASLAEYEAWDKAMQSNEAMQDLLKQSVERNLFESGGVKDHFYTTVS